MRCLPFRIWPNACENLQRPPQPFIGQRIKLFDSYDADIEPLLRVAGFDKVIVHLTARQQYASRFLRSVTSIAKDTVKAAAGEFAQ